MPRVERHVQVSEDIQRLEQKLDTKNSPGFLARAKRSCCLGLVLVFLLVLFMVAAAIAASGWWEIPVMSKLFYRESGPRHLVTKEYTDFKSLLSSRVLTSALKLNDSIRINITEGEITGLFNQLQQENFNQAGYDTIITIEENDVEFFINIPGRPRSPLTVLLKPDLTKHGFEFDIEKVKLGNLTIPRFMNGWVTKLGNNALEPINNQDYLGLIKGMTLKSQAIEIKLDRNGLLDILKQYPL